MALVVISLERAPASVRGELTRWLIEARPGIFVGNVNSLIRDELWNLVRFRTGGEPAVLIYQTNNEQGFAVDLWGEPSYEPIDFDGLTLIRRPSRR